MSKRPQLIQQTKRCIIKIGSALLTDNGKGLDTKAINDWVQQIAQIKHANIDIILVSSDQ